MIRPFASRGVLAEYSCTLPESRAGYESAGLRVADDFEAEPMVVVPAAGELNDRDLADFAWMVRRGVCLILESGLAFADSAGFKRQRRLLRFHFALEIGAPADLWSNGERDPYIEYLWPVRARVRDFSRVVPPLSGEVVARAGSLPVAVKQDIGSGTLVFLGSPLGPALLDGDAGAHRLGDKLFGERQFRIH